MTKKCQQCQKELKLDDVNFRRTLKGTWMNKCRECENKYKRSKYKKCKKYKIKNINPYKEAKNKRLKELRAEYQMKIKILKKHGLTVEAIAIEADKVLDNYNEIKTKSA